MSEYEVESYELKPVEGDDQIELVRAPVLSSAGSHRILTARAR